MAGTKEDLPPTCEGLVALGLVKKDPRPRPYGLEGCLCPSSAHVCTPTARLCGTESDMPSLLDHVPIQHPGISYLDIAGPTSRV